VLDFAIFGVAGAELNLDGVRTLDFGPFETFDESETKNVGERCENKLHLISKRRAGIQAGQFFF